MDDTRTDHELIEGCRRGQQAAWSTLVRRYQRLVYTVPRRAGLGDAQAADVFQACFARLFEHIDRIDDPSRVRAWLVTTARRETLRLIEASQRQVQLTPTVDDEGREGEDPLNQLPDGAPLTEDLLSELQQQDRARRALEQLDPRSRQLLELLFLSEDPLPYSEIASRLGIAEGSIGPTRARALAKMRTLMQG